jgi:hypothetical protein
MTTTHHPTQGLAVRGHDIRRTDRRPLARIGLVILATLLVCLLIPGAAIATSGGKIVVHNGKAAFVRDSGAPATSSAATTGSALITHGPGKAASFVNDSQARIADGLTAVLLVAAAMIVAIVYPGLRGREATVEKARAQTRAPIGHEHRHAV